MKKIRNITLIIFHLIIFNQGFSQLSYEFESEQFEKIILACRNAEFKKAWESKISRDDYYYYFEETRDDEMVVGVTAKALLKYSKNITVIVEIGHPQGGYTSTIQLATFDSNEKLVEKENIGFNSLDNDGGYYTETEFYENKLLEVKEIRVEYTGEENEIKDILSKKYTYYLINEVGFEKITPKLSRYRRFPIVSERILDKDELKEYSKEELDIMRNEIFADCGYIFKTEKWNNYFKLHDWYKPNTEFSESLLTEIEKLNIKNIVEISKNK